MSTYGATPIDLTGLPFTAEQDGMKDDIDMAGIAYSSYNVIRTHGTRPKRLAGVTIYANGCALILYGLSQGATEADIKAQWRLRDHLKATYEILPWSIAEFR